MDEGFHRQLHEGREAFLRGEFFEAHEIWEAVWDEIDDPERRWIQGMIQIATGLHKLSRGRSDVCRTLLEKALAKLVDAPPTLEGLGLEGMREDARQVLLAIGRGEVPSPQAVRLELA